MTWVTGTGELLARLPDSRPHNVTIAHDHQRLICGHDPLRVHDARSGLEIARYACPEHVLLLSPDLSTAIVLREPLGNALLLDLATGRELVDLGNRGYRFSPDGRLVAFSIGSDEIILWDVLERRERTRLKGEWTSPAFSGNGRWLAVELANSIVVYNVEAARRELVCNPPQGFLREVYLSPDGSTLVCITVRLCTNPSADRGVGYYSIVTAWDRTGVECVRENVLLGSGVSFSPDGRYLCINNGRGGAYQLAVDMVDQAEFESRPQLADWTMKILDLSSTPPQEVWSIWDNDIRDARNDRLLGCFAGENVTTSKLLIPAKSISGGSFRDLKFAPDSRSVAVLGEYQYVDSEFGLQVSQWFGSSTKHGYNLTDIILLDVATGNTIGTLEGIGKLEVLFSPDLKTIVTTSGAGEVQLWDHRPRKPLGWLLWLPLALVALSAVWRTRRWVRRRS